MVRNIMKRSGGDPSIYNRGPDSGGREDASEKVVFQLSPGRVDRNWPGQDKGGSRGCGGGGNGELSRQRKQLEPGPEAGRRW